MPKGTTRRYCSEPCAYRYLPVCTQFSVLLTCLRRYDVTGNLIKNSLYRLPFWPLVYVCFLFHCRELLREDDIGSDIHVVLLGGHRVGDALDRISAHRAGRKPLQRSARGRSLEGDVLAAALGHVELTFGHFTHQRRLQAIDSRAGDGDLQFCWMRLRRGCTSP